MFGFSCISIRSFLIWVEYWLNPSIRRTIISLLREYKAENFFFCRSVSMVVFVFLARSFMRSTLMILEIIFLISFIFSSKMEKILSETVKIQSSDVKSGIANEYCIRIFQNKYASFFLPNMIYIFIFFRKS